MAPNSIASDTSELDRIENDLKRIKPNSMEIQIYSDILRIYLQSIDTGDGQRFVTRTCA